MNLPRRYFVAVAWFGTLAVFADLPRAEAITPADPGPGDVAFSVNSGQDVKTISPYIYGSNSSSIDNPTFVRSGGNRWTGYNWETNASNAGADWYHHSDNYLGGGPAGSAVLGTINSTAANGQGYVLTVPMAGYVAADTNGTVDETEIAPSSRWKEVSPRKSDVYSGAQAELSLTPDENDGYVFTDEYVNWVENTKQPGQPVFYSLDNEPALWGETLPPGWQSGAEPNPCCDPANGVDPSPEGRTHPTIHPYEPTFTEMRDKTIAHASAIKDVNSDALVFGGVGYGWGAFTNLQGAPDAVTNPSHPGGDQPSGEMHYYEWLLNEVHAEEVAQGRKLMDVLDLHWYPEAQGGGVRITQNNTSTAVVEARVQAPRSLWDPTYTETSWISQWGTWVGSSGNPGPIALLPRVQRDVDDFNPGTKIAITEYNYGAGSHISGAIAEADVLGIFGEYGIFAASWWGDGTTGNYTSAAFDMYVDYDGAGGHFGDTSVDADTDDIDSTAIYASIDSEDPNRMVLVAINRTGTAQDIALSIEHDRVFDHAEVYELTSGLLGPSINQQADIELSLLNAFHYTLPAWGVSTLVLISDGLPGDYNGDGTVDAADYAFWRDSVGQTGDVAADGNEDDIVDEGDYLLWRANFGRTELGGGAGASLAAVPEPGSATLLGLALVGGACWRRRSRRSAR